MGRRYKKIIAEKVTFTGFADKGRSVGRDEQGRVFFVEDVAPGDVADILVLKKKKGFLMGVPQHFHKRSDHRTDPFCQHFDNCGGCQYQHISYEAQLVHKEKVVRDAIERIAKLQPEEFFPILGGERTTYYRNKMEYAFSCKRWLTHEEIQTDISNLEDVLGFHRAGAFDKIVDIKHCWLQEEPSNDLRNTIKALAIEQGLSFYDMRENKGFLRHIMIRVTTLGEILLILSISRDDQEKIKGLLDATIEKFPPLTSVYYCVNPKVNDYLLDLDMISYYGKGYVEEQLGHVKFQIGPKSFFQTNTRQGKVLYDVVKDFAGLQGHENVYDLYSGLGSIALYVAKHCKQVVGIEEIEAAVNDARINSKLNGIDNAVFYAGDVKDILTENFAQEHGKPDLLITDPPRAGMHPKVVDYLLKLEAPKLVYVSCNPATQARDLALLNEKYDLKKIQPVDMFPNTYHIENVALLELKK